MFLFYIVCTCSHSGKRLHNLHYALVFQTTLLVEASAPSTIILFQAYQSLLLTHYVDTKCRTSIRYDTLEKRRNVSLFKCNNIFTHIQPDITRMNKYAKHSLSDKTSIQIRGCYTNSRCVEIARHQGVKSCVSKSITSIDKVPKIGRGGSHSTKLSFSCLKRAETRVGTMPNRGTRTRHTHAPQSHSLPADLHTVLKSVSMAQQGGNAFSVMG